MQASCCKGVGRFRSRNCRATSSRSLCDLGLKNLGTQYPTTYDICAKLHVFYDTRSVVKEALQRKEWSFNPAAWAKPSADLDDVQEKNLGPAEGQSLA